MHRDEVVVVQENLFDVVDCVHIDWQWVYEAHFRKIQLGALSCEVAVLTYLCGEPSVSVFVLLYP
jgi:hypothetical protein